MKVFSFRFCLFCIFAIAFLLLQADGKASGGNDMPTKKWNGMEGKDGYGWSKKVFNAANVCQSSYQKIVVFLYFVVFPIIRSSRLYGCA